MTQFYNDSIFWVDVEKIKPNPYQPRREFDQVALQSLSDSIRQYGVLQALVVTRKEFQKEDGGLGVEYELIAGERRLRASKLAGLQQVPVLIKVGDDTTDLLKLELAIIENIQREDLNPVDRARAFEKLASEFGFKHTQIAEKVGKSRVYVTNTLRILSLPPEMLDAISEGKITEGHSRPLLALFDRPEEQMTLFKEIMFKRLTVRQAEDIARRIAYERARRKDAQMDPVFQEMEEALTESLGTRVVIEKKESGGKISIDFFNEDDLKTILQMIQQNKKMSPTAMMDAHIAKISQPTPEPASAPELSSAPEALEQSETIQPPAPEEVATSLEDRTPAEIKHDENTEDESLYSIKDFSI